MKMMLISFIYLESTIIALPILAICIKISISRISKIIDDLSLHYKLWKNYLVSISRGASQFIIAGFKCGPINSLSRENRRTPFGCWYLLSRRTMANESWWIRSRNSSLERREKSWKAKAIIITLALAVIIIIASLTPWIALVITLGNWAVWRVRLNSVCERWYKSERITERIK